MATFVTDPRIEESLSAARQAYDIDRDEVWEGVRMMTPLPNVEHQDLVSRLAFALQSMLGNESGARIFPGINLSDRVQGWEQNFRGPDVAVFLSDTKAKNCGTHWCGAADFLVEIVSPHDRTRDKLAFYSQIGVRELLIVDRQPWAIELWRLHDRQLVETGRSTIDATTFLDNQVLPVRFRLAQGAERPQIEVVKLDGSQTMLA